MQECVGAEHVVVPYESVLEVLFYGIERYVGEIAFLHISVESPESDVEAECLGSRPPEMFLAVVCDIESGGTTGATAFLIAIWAEAETTQSAENASIVSVAKICFLVFDIAYSVFLGASYKCMTLLRYNKNASPGVGAKHEKIRLPFVATGF